jgi:hypothetical protein
LVAVAPFLVTVGPFLVAVSLAVGSLLSKLLAALCAIRPQLGSTLLHAALLAARIETVTKSTPRTTVTVTTITTTPVATASTVIWARLNSSH